jgi:hypothetical protein
MTQKKWDESLSSSLRHQNRLYVYVLGEMAEGHERVNGFFKRCQANKRK